MSPRQTSGQVLKIIKTFQLQNLSASKYVWSALIFLKSQSPRDLKTMLVLIRTSACFFIQPSLCSKSFVNIWKRACFKNEMYLWVCWTASPFYYTNNDFNADAQPVILCYLLCNPFTDPSSLIEERSHKVAITTIMWQPQTKTKDRSSLRHWLSNPPPVCQANMDFI